MEGQARGPNEHRRMQYSPLTPSWNRWHKRRRKLMPITISISWPILCHISSNAACLIKNPAKPLQQILSQVNDIWWDLSLSKEMTSGNNKYEIIAVNIPIRPSSNQHRQAVIQNVILILEIYDEVCKQTYSWGPVHPCHGLTCDQAIKKIKK